MPRYVAIINTPTYLSEQDDPPVFDTPQWAWEYLANERREAEDSAFDAGLTTGTGYSATVNTLESLGNGTLGFEEVGDGDGTGTVHGDSTTEKMYDLGVNYSVEVWVPTEDDCEGHESLRGDSMGATVYCDGTCRS